MHEMIEFPIHQIMGLETHIRLEAQVFYIYICFTYDHDTQPPLSFANLRWFFYIFVEY